MSTPSFTCPRCGMQSFNRNDVIYGYCGRCHDFTRTRIVDYLDIESSQLGFGEKRSWPQTKEQMEELNRIVRQGGVRILPWKGHNLFRDVYGHDAPEDHRFSLEDIAELCRLYIEKHKDKS